MSVLISPNMSLHIPSVGAENGPDYAYDINSCLTLIDQHDHSPGKGVQINPAGININTTLNFNSQQATNLLSTSFTAQSSATTVTQALSVAPGSETPSPIQDLWYTDSNGTAVQITSNGSVFAPTAAIVGLSYSAGTWTATQAQDSLPTNPANFSMGALTLRPNVAATSNGITIEPPSGIATAWTLTLPADPSTAGGSNFLVMDTAGNVTGGALVDNSSIQYTSHQLSVKPGGITDAMLASGVRQLTSQTFLASNSFVVPASSSVIFVTAVGGGGGGGGGAYNGGAASTANGGGGGGGGGTTVLPIAVTPGETLNVTVGLGGFAGAGSTTTASAGGVGNPSFVSRSGTLLVLGVGGSAGGGATSGASSPGAGGAGPDLTNPMSLLKASGGAGGSGGVGGNGSISLYQSSLIGSTGTSTSGFGSGGGGGSSYGQGANGGNGAPGGAATAGANGAANSGAGGGGGAAGGTSRAGGIGGSGAVIITWVG